MSKAQELKPCPFCGFECVTMEQYKSDGLRIICKGCAVKREQRTMYKSLDWLREGMIEDWNRRAPASSEQQAAQQDERIAKITTAYGELSKILHDQIVAQQSAWIEWQHGQGAEAAMVWIGNGLWGPGHIPDEDAPYGKEAQAWYDANNSDPFPACHCGRPSNIMSMGIGFCCKAHHDAARASNGGKAND